jgi:hypothetical protein
MNERIVCAVAPRDTVRNTVLVVRLAICSSERDGALHHRLDHIKSDQ